MQKGVTSADLIAGGTARRASRAGRRRAARGHPCAARGPARGGRRGRSSLRAERSRHRGRQVGT